MAYFAVIREGDTPFGVVQCHVNFWCLGGLAWHRTFVWDVGLRLKGTGDQRVSTFLLALPFGTTTKPIDLRSRLVDQRTAELVFGSPVTIQGRQIEYNRESVELGSIDSTEKLEDKSGASHSVWRIQFAPALANAAEVYLRLRFEVSDSGQIWVWKRSLWRRNGAIVDVRIADVREGVVASNWSGFEQSIVTLGKLNFLVIAPDFLRLRSVSPDLRYMRLLESPAWESYLGRVPNLNRGRRMIIFHWRYPDSGGHEIDVEHPFLGFLDLARDDPFSRTENHVRATLLLILVGSAIYYFGQPTANSVASLVAAHPWKSGIGSASLVALFFGVINRWPILVWVAKLANSAATAVEKFLVRPSGQR